MMLALWLGDDVVVKGRLEDCDQISPTAELLMNFVRQISMRLLLGLMMLVLRLQSWTHLLRAPSSALRIRDV